MKNCKLRLESLEDRCLLAVVAGSEESAVVLPEPTEAVTWWVATTEDTTGGEDFSLRDALLQAKSGDTIRFFSRLSGKTITLSGTQLAVPAGVTVDASDLSDGIAINADGRCRVFYLNGGADNAPTVLKGLRIIGGYGLYYGGGIYNDGKLTMTNCTVSENTVRTSNWGGGGIFNRGTLTMTNCTVSGNTSYSLDGAGIYNRGTLTMTNCTVSGNTSSSRQGGGIYNDGNSTLTLTSCAVSGNTAANGGGIYNGGTLTMTNCSVVNNSATSYGSGIYNGNIYNSIYDNTPTLTLRNSIIVQNAIYKYNGTINGSNLLSTFTGWDSSSNCIYYDSSLPLFTNMSAGDYTLATGSQAIDIGDNSFVTTDTDLAGKARIVNEIVDLGAYEYQIVKPSITDVSITGWTGYEDGDPHTVKLTDPQRTTDTIVYTYNGQTFNQNPPAFYDPGTYTISVVVSREGYKDWEGSAVVEIKEYVTEPLASPTILTGVGSGAYVSAGVNRHEITWGAVTSAVRYELAYSDNGQTWTTLSTNDTSLVISGLAYGKDVRYKVRAIADNVHFTDSDWSAVKSFNVCPMDINNDGDISGVDRVILASAWGSEAGENAYILAADINGDGDVSGVDRNFLGSNWGAEAGDDDLAYPAPRAADFIFAGFESGYLDIELDVF
ncbi:MAG: right-handed parallel beta-helix repeat-containing protein [Thermoguttaceae bacterium]|nr:right-handed parallel beta-helix repeat-containing protein [Thermoguttaceae bacterium]